MKILIGYDGSEASHAAVTDLRRAGLPDHAVALVLTSPEVQAVQPAVGFLPPLDGGLLSPATAEEIRAAAAREHARARSVASDGARVVKELFPSWVVRSDAPPGGPAYSSIVEHAEAWAADLIVVGSHGRSLLGRLVLGSVAQNVLSHAPCSVRIGRGQVPGSDKPLGFPLRVLLGVDGSSESMAAVHAVRARAWPVGTEVRLAAVTDLRLALALIDAGSTVAEADEAYEAGGHGSPAVERVLRSASDGLRDVPGLTVTSDVLEGDAKHVLLREAECWGADCVVLGARGHSRLERFLIGSVSAAVAARARCSVEVIREPRASS